MKEGGTVGFGGNQTGKIIGSGTIEASEEDHNTSQQVIQSKNSFKYKSSHPEEQIITKIVPEEQDHTLDQKSLLWDFCP